MSTGFNSVKITGAISLPVMILSMVLVAITVAGAGYWFFVREEPAVVVDPASMQPQYLTLKDLVVNLRDEDNEPHYMQLEVAIMTRSPRCLEALEKYKPVIRNALLDSFAEQYYLKMLEPDSRKIIREKALAALKNLTPNIKPGKIENVLITNLVVQ